MELIKTFAQTALLTVVIELAVLLLLGERRRWLLWSSVFINIFTNLMLNAALFQLGYSTTNIIVGELTVIIVETLWYFYFLRSWPRAFAYSLLCNVASLSLGMLLQAAYAYFVSP
ncbi:MAG: hypothetical protein IJ551_02385 [Prevotella sp.]|nr:hypothetical protein [Prevotella sp.]